MEEGAFGNQSCSTSYTTASPQLGIPSFLAKGGREVSKTYICKPRARQLCRHKGEPNRFFCPKNVQ